MNHLLTEIADRYHLKRKTGKYVGPCPKCGGSSSSDKFNIKDDGGYKCYSCDFKGDIITWLRDMENMNCPQAYEAAGMDCRATSCPVVDTCRLGSGSGSGRRKVNSVAPRSNRKTSSLPLPTVKGPKDSWEKWARSLVVKGEENIQEQEEVLQWLAGRGINMDAVIRFHIGWLDHDRQVKRGKIGLKDKDGKGKLWVPGGLLIPIIDRAGKIHRIRIRRPKDARERFLGNLKYVWISGSGTHPKVIRPLGKIRGCVIVEAELDAIAVAAAHDGVLVVALGTVSAGIPDPLRTELINIPVIMVALDAESGKDGAIGAGPKAIASWKQEYRQAKFWPVPQGKDPGNYAEVGGDLSTWVNSGLIPEPISANQSHDFVFSPGHYQRGEGVRENLNPGKTETPAETAVATAVENDVKKNQDSPADSLESVPGLRACPICLGNLFLKGERGGCFCVQCQPVSIHGKLVRASKLRGHYVVS